MDKLYTYGFDLKTNTVKVREDPVIRETELTVTIKNCIGQEVRFRKGRLGKLSEERVMHLDKPDMAYYLRKLIEASNHSLQTLMGMFSNESVRLQKLHDMLGEAENDGKEKIQSL